MRFDILKKILLVILTYMVWLVLLLSCDFYFRIPYGKLLWLIDYNVAVKWLFFLEVLFVQYIISMHPPLKNKKEIIMFNVIAFICATYVAGLFYGWWEPEWLLRRAYG